MAGTPQIDWTRWRRLPDGRGFVRVPPPACPACGAAWSQTGGKASPREESVACSCTLERRHHVWRCWCGAWSAEGCMDVTQWSQGTVPVTVTVEQRHALAP